MKNSTLEQRLAYIKANLHVLSEDDGLMDTVKAITEKRISDYIGFYPRESRFFGSRLFDFEESVEWNKARFDEWLRRNYNSDKKMFLAYAMNNSLFWHYHFRITSDGNFTISDIQYSASNLIYFLRFMIFGEYDVDFGPAMKIAEELKKADYNLKGIKIGDITLDIKSYKNGRLDIKGLTPKLLTNIRRMIEGKKNSHINRNYNGEWGHNY